MNNPENINNLKLNQRLSRKVSINLNSNGNNNTQRLQLNEYGYLSSNERKSPHKLNRVYLSTQKVEEYLTGKDLKFITPNNLSHRISLDRESEAASTKESNQFQSMKKISKSIDRLKAKAKLLGMNHLSAPTENRDYSIGLKALDPLDKFDIPTTPKISVLNKIQNVNENFKDAFKYSDKDIEMLSQHPLILRKVTNWGENLTSDYLLDLKKKERQIVRK